jgi:Uma2 family endonuclease
MAAMTLPTTESDQIVSMPVPWETYEALLASRAETRRPRMAYLDGVVELMTTSVQHERIKFLLGRLLERYAIALGRDFVAFGAATQKSKARSAGLEPDESYALTANATHPDLAIEVVWKSGVVNKMEIYRRLAIREVWVWRANSLVVHQLRDDVYVPCTTSALLPGVDVELLASFLDRPAGSATILEFEAALAVRRA